MDLAEIRKKARAQSNRTPAAPAQEMGRPAPDPPALAPPPVAAASAGSGTSALSAVSSTPSVPGVSGTPISPAPPCPVVAPPVEDAIEALFRASVAREEYLEVTGLQNLGLPEKEKVTDLRQMLTFTLGSEDYALDIDSIREIIKPREITDIPRVPEFIMGIISLRGIIIPVFDLKRRLRLGAGEMKSTSRIIVCQQEEKIIGLLVDGISQVIRIAASSIEPPPAVLSGLDRDMVEGVGRYQGRMTILLRLSCVMDAELI